MRVLRDRIGQAGRGPAHLLFRADISRPEWQRDALDGLLDVASELDTRSAGLVVAGPAESAVDGGLVRALRADSARDAVISSVDNADRAVGQVATVLALREQSDGGAGRYGGAQGASSPVPTGAPDEDDDQG